MPLPREPTDTALAMDVLSEKAVFNSLTQRDRDGDGDGDGDDDERDGPYDDDDDFEEGSGRGLDGDEEILMTCELEASTTSYAPGTIRIRAIGGTYSNPLCPRKASGGVVPTCCVEPSSRVCFDPRTYLSFSPAFLSPGGCFVCRSSRSAW